ncbi:MAG: caspase family protein [Bacteroidota bacterium]
MAKLNALLVGINDYQAPVPPLKGCINDVDQMHTVLKQLTFFDQKSFKVLKNEKATKLAIVKAFQEHLSKASSEDVILFYFSGHGTREWAPPIFEEASRSNVLQCIIPFDGIVDKQYNLIADKELRYLIQQLEATKAHILTIFDCCNAGENTRMGDEVRLRRFLPPNASEICPARPIQDFIFYKTLVEQTQKHWTEILPEGQHIQIAATLPNSYAYEANGRGIFTQALIDLLEKARFRITYYDLLVRLRTYVGNHYNQVPNLYIAGDQEKLKYNGVFGQKLDGSGALLGKLTQDKQKNWQLDMGSIHGLSTQVEKLDILNANGEAFTKGKVVQVEVSSAKILPDIVLEEEPLYYAELKSQLVKQLPVFMEKNKDQQTIKAALNKEKDLEIHWVDDPSLAKYQLNVDDQFYIGPPNDPFFSLVRPFNKTELLTAYLKHIARWEFVKALYHPLPKHLDHSPVAVNVYHKKKHAIEEEVAIAMDSISINGMEEEQSSIRIKLTNISQQRLYVSVLYLSMHFQIYTRMLPQPVIELEPHAEVWLWDGRMIPLQIEKEVIEYKLSESVSYFKLIYSSTSFDVSLWEQEALPSQYDEVDRAGRAQSDDIHLQSNLEWWSSRLLTLRIMR